MADSPTTTRRYLPGGLVRFFQSWRFPTLVLSVLLCLTLPVVTVILVPESSSWLGRLARDFKTWCFGYDATGGIDWVYLALTIANPTLIGAFVVGIWWKPLERGWKRHRTAMVRWALYGAFAVVAAGSTLAVLGPSESRSDAKPFPASRLRTAIDPPEIQLTDQQRRQVRLQDYVGEKVVLVTAVYASCQTVCPRMIERIKRAIGRLSPEQRSMVVVLGLTLDPQHDRPEQLAGMAERHDIGAPRYHFLTGKPSKVERTLRDLGVSWDRNPETGMIQHSSLFALVDIDGAIAYRLTLGDNERTWLSSALDVLTTEALDE